jgi:hypothetical protein
VRLAIFGSLRADASYAIGKAKLRPAKTADFLAPLPSQNKQANDGAIVQIAGMPPHEAKFVIGEDAIARRFIYCFVRADDRV